MATPCAQAALRAQAAGVRGNLARRWVLPVGQDVRLRPAAQTWAAAQAADWTGTGGSGQVAGLMDGGSRLRAEPRLSGPAGSQATATACRASAQSEAPHVAEGGWGAPGVTPTLWAAGHSVAWREGRWVRRLSGLLDRHAGRALCQAQRGRCACQQRWARGWGRCQGNWVAGAFSAGSWHAQAGQRPGRSCLFPPTARSCEARPDPGPASPVSSAAGTGSPKSPAPFPTFSPGFGLALARPLPTEP